MPDNDLQSGFAAKMLGELLGKIHRPVLSTGAAERNHQILETSILIRVEARAHKRDHIGEELMGTRSEEHTSELQSRPHLVCRLLLEKKKKKKQYKQTIQI